MHPHFYPSCEREIIEIVSSALGDGDRLAIVGGGTKWQIGRSVDCPLISLGRLTGVVDYDPAELVLTARPGTPLTEIEALIAGERQMLAFEPYDHAPIFGGALGTATIGGIFAAAVAGSRRLTAGRARDHLLGVRAISGRADLFVSGAKVVKNVTGFDLPKLLAGSWGRLGIITELTMKLLPRPETTATCMVMGLDPSAAIRAMAKAMGSQADVACAAYRPSSDWQTAICALRVEGFAPSVESRCGKLQALLAGHGEIVRAGQGEADAFWSELRSLASLSATNPLWCVNLPPSSAPAFLNDVAAERDQYLMDWAGGLIWLATPDSAGRVRAAAERRGGHAMLIRADAVTRRDIAAFPSQPPALAALEERVRRAFDPNSIFETGRF
ncbi:FAD-binding protein [Sphingopyxis kveilinensis]|uniref:FAD-binding protein n=1 Tax=Sphingopyxis kveilinensis TaxID=3114367 RepID=UPI0030CBDF60